MTQPSPQPRTPRWVKMAGIAVAIFTALLVLGLLLGGGQHGPGRHMSSAAVPVGSEIQR